MPTTKKNEVQEWSINLKKRFDDLGKTQAEFSRKYGIDKGTVSKWVHGLHMPGSYGRDCLCEFLEVPDWNWFLSQEERDRLASDRELKRLLSSTHCVYGTIEVFRSKEALQMLNDTYSFLKTLGFEEVVKKLELQGKTASIANLILMWGSVFSRFYHALEPLIENYCSDESEIMELYRKEVKSDCVVSSEQLLKDHCPDTSEIIIEPDQKVIELDDWLDNQRVKLGKKYSFSLHGTFDDFGNIVFDLYEKRPAPKEQDKSGE